MKFESRIHVHSNFLSENIFNEIEYYLRNTPKWTINRSNISDNNIFWGMDLTQEQLFNRTIFTTIQQKIDKNLKLNRIIANGQSTLQDGVPHTDSLLLNARTLIIYVNSRWEYSWAGQTFFFNSYAIEEQEDIIKMGDEIKTIYPMPNTAVYFPSNMYHYGAAPSKLFNGIRFTISYHMELISGATNEK